MHGHRALLAHPRDGDGGVEAAGERDADAFADREGGQDLAHGDSFGVGVRLLVGSPAGERAPLASARKRAASAGPPSGRRLITSTVSSPAMVPSTSSSSARSNAEARNCAAPGGVRSRARLAEASAETSSSPSSRASRASDGGGLRGPRRRAVAALGGHGVDQGAGGDPHLDGVELDEVARQRRLGDVHAGLGEQLGQLGLRAHRRAGPSRSTIFCWRAPLVSAGCAARHGVPPGWASSQVSSAFWACSRFSASSQTTLCGPSMTSAAISLPR